MLHTLPNEGGEKFPTMGKKYIIGECFGRFSSIEGTLRRPQRWISAQRRKKKINDHQIYITICTNFLAIKLYFVGEKY